MAHERRTPNRSRRALAAAAVFVLLLAGCGDPELVGIEVVDPSGSWVLWGGPQRTFRASGFYSDGSEKNVSEVAAWDSSNPSIATVSPGGTVTKVTTGEIVLTATLDGLSGSLVVPIR